MSSRDAAAQDGLLAEQVRLSLLRERGLQCAGPGAADRLRVGQRERPGATGGVTLDRDEDGHSSALAELAAHQMPRSLRRHHAHVHGWRRRDEAVADVQAMGEEERVAVAEGGSIASAYSERCAVSGTRTMITLASSHACAGVVTRRPSFSAFSRARRAAAEGPPARPPRSRGARARARAPGCRIRARPHGGPEAR